MTTVLRMPIRSVNSSVMDDLQQKYPDAELQVNIDNVPGSAGMPEARFWELIALLDWSQTDDDEAVIKPLVEALAAGPVREIYEFQDWLATKLYALDAQIYAEQIGEDAYQPDIYFSVDIFLYARCCVIANGRAAYEQVLQNPKEIPKDLTFESLLYVASEAYERKTGKSFHYMPAFSIETYSNLEGWPA